MENEIKNKLKQKFLMAAYDADGNPPAELKIDGIEWCACHATSEERRWILECASDPKCPHRYFFINVLDEFAETFTEMHKCQYVETFQDLVKAVSEVSSIDPDDIESLNDIIVKTKLSRDPSIHYLHLRIMRKLRNNCRQSS